LELFAMAQAAATLMGLVLLWLMLSPWVEDAAALAIGGACVVCAYAGGRWLGAAEPELPRSIQSPRSPSAFERALAALRAGSRVARAAISPARLRPAFVKIKARGDRDRTGLAETIAPSVGAVVVEIEADGFLLHTIDEEAIDPQALKSFATGGAAPREGGVA
jgi:hypothetical protein